MSDPKDHNPHVAEIYRAMALRFYSRYLDARRYTDHHGDDLQGYGPLPTEREADDRYQIEADGCVIEAADSAEAALALVRFAGVIAADRLIGEAMEEPVNDERDAYHQAVALANAAGWINKIAIDEYVERIRAARRGPVAVPPNEQRECSMSEAFPETPEAVAFELLLAVAEAEGRPVRRRQQRQRRDSGGMNQPPRFYIFDLHAECFSVARGDRSRSIEGRMH